MQSNNPGRTWGRLGTVLACAAWILSAVPSLAAPPELKLPIDCELGRTCWLVNFVDHDPGPGAQDFRCGPVVYDTHKGTDFAIRDGAAVTAGVRVLAAAPGTVRAVRDGMPATRPEDLEHRERLAGRECGNGVVINHADGWSTQYCHMDQGTIAVKAGDHVEAGTPLGKVGQSGLAEFPHVHLQVTQGNTIIDPFTGSSNIAACNASAATGGLWAPDVRAQLAYPGPQPYHLGFADAAPDVRQIRAGALNGTRLAARAPALVFWAEAFSVAMGDKIQLRLAGPEGEVIAREIVVDRPLARWFGFVGKKLTADAWPTGAYTGTIRIDRNGAVATTDATLTVE